MTSSFIQVKACRILQQALFVWGKGNLLCTNQEELQRLCREAEMTIYAKNKRYLNSGSSPNQGEFTQCRKFTQDELMLLRSQCLTGLMVSGTLSRRIKRENELSRLNLNSNGVASHRQRLPHSVSAPIAEILHQKSPPLCFALSQTHKLRHVVSIVKESCRSLGLTINLAKGVTIRALPV
jgi:hypothetical protein